MMGEDCLFEVGCYNGDLREGVGIWMCGIRIGMGMGMGMGRSMVVVCDAWFLVDGSGGWLGVLSFSFLWHPWSQVQKMVGDGMPIDDLRKGRMRKLLFVTFRNFFGAGNFRRKTIVATNFPSRTKNPSAEIHSSKLIAFRVSQPHCCHHGRCSSCRIAIESAGP